MLYEKKKIDPSIPIEYDLVIRNVKHLFRKGNQRGLRYKFNNVRGGVYVVYSNALTVIYVGTSRYIVQRLKVHINSSGSKIANEIMFIGILKEESYNRFKDMNPNCTDDVEYCLIDMLKPKYNIKTKKTININTYDDLFKNISQEDINKSLRNFSIGSYDKEAMAKKEDKIKAMREKVLAKRKREKAKGKKK